MRRFQWSSKQSIQMPGFDAEHRSLYETAGELDRAMLAGAGPEELQALVKEARMQLTSHFSHEERLMRRSNYASHDWHKRQHAAAAKKVRALEREVAAGNRDAVPELLAFFSEWLPQHLGVSDRMMAAHLRNHARAAAALAS